MTGGTVLPFIRPMVMWFIGKLGSVPDRDDPDGLALGAIEEAIRWNDDLSKRKIGEFG